MGLFRRKREGVVFCGEEADGGEEAERLSCADVEAVAVVTVMPAYGGRVDDGGGEEGGDEVDVVADEGVGVAEEAREELGDGGVPEGACGEEVSEGDEFGEDLLREGKGDVGAELAQLALNDCLVVGGRRREGAC